MSPNINDFYPSKHLKAHDLNGHEPIVTIERVEFEPIGQKREIVPVLYFVGKDKGLKLNKTMGNKLIEITGSAITEEWAGTKIKLYESEATYGGDTYDVVRIKAATNGKPKMSRMTPAAPAAPPKPPSEPDPDTHFNGELTDEDIPF